MSGRAEAFYEAVRIAHGSAVGGVIRLANQDRKNPAADIYEGVWGSGAALLAREGRAEKLKATYLPSHEIS